MGKIVVYDKASWHLESDSPTGLEHLQAIMDWLNQQKLLSEEGLEIFELGVDQEFSLTSEMVTEEGKDLLDSYYTNWTKAITPSEISLEILNRGLSSIRK
ncbi:hypothetical protein [Paenibacillus sp. FSL K6-2862]|uniref:hypothetical protein n=1 Tax=Paenibacillus sp. FSL K6-2862 TaxID=2921484 RepID=UPI0030F9A8A9